MDNLFLVLSLYGIGTVFFGYCFHTVTSNQFEIGERIKSLETVISQQDRKRHSK